MKSLRKVIENDIRCRIAILIEQRRADIAGHIILLRKPDFEVSEGDMRRIVDEQIDSILTRIAPAGSR